VTDCSWKRIVDTVSDSFFQSLTFFLSEAHIFIVTEEFHRLWCWYPRKLRKVEHGLHTVHKQYTHTQYTHSIHTHTHTDTHTHTRTHTHTHTVHTHRHTHTHTHTHTQHAHTQHARAHTHTHTHRHTHKSLTGKLEAGSCQTLGRHNVFDWPVAKGQPAPILVVEAVGSESLNFLLPTRLEQLNLLLVQNVPVKEDKIVNGVSLVEIISLEYSYIATYQAVFSA